MRLILPLVTRPILLVVKTKQKIGCVTKPYLVLSSHIHVRSYFLKGLVLCLVIIVVIRSNFGPKLKLRNGAGMANKG